MFAIFWFIRLFQFAKVAGGGMRIAFIFRPSLLPGALLDGGITGVVIVPPVGYTNTEKTVWDVDRHRAGMVWVQGRKVIG
jgi:hypothetical protein